MLYTTVPYSGHPAFVGCVSSFVHMSAGVDMPCNFRRGSLPSSSLRENPFVVAPTASPRLADPAASGCSVSSSCLSRGALQLQMSRLCVWFLCGLWAFELRSHWQALELLSYLPSLPFRFCSSGLPQHGDSSVATFPTQCFCFFSLTLTAAHKPCYFILFHQAAIKMYHKQRG